MPRNYRARAGVLVPLLMILSGCGSGAGYQEVSGSVTFQGKPVEEGTIQFFLPGSPPVPCAGAMIVQGKYQVPKEHGLKPGKYLIRISSPERLANTPHADPMNPFLARERLPRKYNTESQLTIEIRDRERGRANFDLQ